MAKNDWYVAYDSSIGIDGPMSKDEATRIQESVEDAIVFQFGDLEIMLDAKAKNFVVRGTINGGVLSLDEVSEGIEVDIRDYDVEGMEEDDERLEEDEDGDMYVSVS